MNEKNNWIFWVGSGIAATILMGAIKLFATAINMAVAFLLLG